MLQIQAMKVGVKPGLLQAGHDAVSKFANTLAAGNVPGGRQSFRGGGRAASRRGLRFGAGPGTTGRRRLLFLQTGYRRSGRPFGQPFAFFALVVCLWHIFSFRHGAQPRVLCGSITVAAALARRTLDTTERTG